ncbi:MAG: hypothetical protein Tsb002_18220 [Wenzhouxiangellaceae bacterium]
MSQLWKRAIIIGAIMIAAGTVYAGHGSRGGHHGAHHHMGNEKHIANMIEQLNLSEAQAEQVTAIVSATHAEIGVLHDNLHQQVCDLHNQAMTEVGAVLNPDQLAQLEAMHQQRWERAGRPACD